MRRSNRLSASFLRSAAFAFLRAAALLALVAAAGDIQCEAQPMNSIRPSALAGSWYPADPGKLTAEVDAHLAAGQGLEAIALHRPIALIAPHAGHQWSGDAAGQAFRLIEGSAGNDITRVILLGPSHYQGFRGASVPDASAFATPLGNVPVDVEVAAALARSPGFVSAPAAHAREHCLEIQLPFLQRALGHPFRIVPVLVSSLDPAGRDALARTLARHVDEHTLLVASSDFTHFGGRFGYLPFVSDSAAALDRDLRLLDKGALAPILALDAAALDAYHDETDITVCGIHPIGTLIQILSQPDLQKAWKGTPQGRVLDYYRSADLTGDFDGSVSYAAVAFFRPGELKPGADYPEKLAAVKLAGERAGGASASRASAPDSSDSAASPMRLTKDEERFLLALARDTVERLTSGRKPAKEVSFPADVSAEKMRTPCGAFVTLTRNERLRGCIGSLAGDEPLYACVIANAGNAAMRDPRFSPVTAKEVDGLAIEISVLTPMRAIAGPEEIEIGRHGVVLEKSGHRAVFLPQVAPEQGWDRDTMLDHLAVKAGLAPGDWRSGARFQVFEALVFSEEREGAPGGR